MLGGDLRSEVDENGVTHVRLVAPVQYVRGSAGWTKTHVAHRLAKKKTKRMTKASGKFWPEQKRCCDKALLENGQACCSAYGNVLVYRLRTYMATLSDSMQRDFVRQRTVYKEGHADIPMDEDLTKIPLRVMMMESPAILNRRLIAWDGGKGPYLPAPTSLESKYMCTKFFLNMIQRSISWAYPHTVRTNLRFVPPGFRTAFDREMPMNPEAKMYERSGVKGDTVVSWMQDQSTLHCMLPNAEGTVLPYATKYAAHAAYVLEMEAVEGFADREMSGQEFDRRQRMVEDSVDIHRYEDAEDDDAEHAAGRQMDDDLDEESRPAEEDIEAEDEQVHVAIEAVDGLEDEPSAVMNERAGSRRNKKSPYRYGNPLLGLKSDIAECGGPIANYRWFVKQWRHKPGPGATGHPEAPILKLRTWMPFAKCDDCIKRRKQQEKEKDREALKIILEEQRRHIRFVKRERMSYHLRQHMAIRSDEYLSIIIDGADQKAHGIPHTCAKSHLSDAAWKLKLHLLGAIVHGQGVYVYTCPANFAQGHNITIQVLFDVLEQVRQDKGVVKLPEVLLLQLDNTTKQNKGKYLMAFLALLVEAGTFRKILVSFLPVGHTHEDIDQFFSRIAMALRRQDAHSRLDFGRIISKVAGTYSSWGLAPKVRHWDNVANISDWMDSRLLDMEDITKWHQFKLAKCKSTSRVLLMAREWPGDSGDHWTGFSKNLTDQPIWRGEPPNLLLEYDEVPNAKEPCQPPSLDKISKTKQGVEQLLEHLRVAPEGTQDTLALLALYSTPASTISFAWNKDVIRSLLGDEHRNLGGGAVPPDQHDEDDPAPWQATEDCLIVENCFYLLQPPEGSVEPFWVCKIKKRIWENDEPVVCVQYWEPTTEGKKSRVKRDYYGCEYGCAASNPPSTHFSNLDKLGVKEGFTIQLNMKIGKEGGAHIVAGRNEKLHEEIRWWVTVWNSKGNMVLSDDEELPMHLVPEGELEVPGPKERKKRRRPVSAAGLEGAAPVAPELPGAAKKHKKSDKKATISKRKPHAKKK